MKKEITPTEKEIINLYLTLMKRCLTFYIWGDTLGPVYIDDLRGRMLRIIFARLSKWLGKKGHYIYRTIKFNPELRELGKDHPSMAHTMIGLRRLDSIQSCVEDIITNGVEGDLIETGIWRGGAAIFMRAILKAYGVKDRKVWAADSFKGLPKPNVEKYPADQGDYHYLMTNLAVSREEVEQNFMRYDLLDDQVYFLEGWFKDTLPNAPINKLAVMRLDGDMYESTMDALTALYPKLSLGGYVIIDDYGYTTSCRQAVEDYRNANRIKDEIFQVDWSGVFWKRS
jgi:hypothetical protein